MRRIFTDDEFARLLDDVQESALRLELQPTYRVTAEADSVAALLAGQPSDPTAIEGMPEWFASVRGVIKRGGRVERVRVQEDPPTDYQRWERWFDEVANTPAGEVIRYMTRARALEVGLLPAAGDVDWWLMDGRRLIEMHFDAGGDRVRTEVTADPAAIARAREWWDLAVRHSAPLGGAQA
jgi:hypothetical protein